MTIGASSMDTSYSICPVDGTATDVLTLADANRTHDKTRYEEWIAAYRYQADQMLLMSLASQVAQQYFADKSLEASLDAADKSYDVANRQMIIAEDEYARYKERFFCNEHNLATEACEVFDENPQYDVATARAGRNARLGFAPMHVAYRRARSRYCMCDNLADFCDLSRDEALATVAARNFAFEAEDVRAKSRRETYDNLRLEVVNIGQKIQTTQLNTYQGAMGTANSAINAAGNARVQRNGVWAGGINNVLSAYFTPRISAPQLYSGGSGGGFFGGMGSGNTAAPFTGGMNVPTDGGLY